MKKDEAVPLSLIQNGVFEILKYVRDVCDQNRLTYYLAYGTLIGAVRHQGFIPWDDDIDIHMPREDFLRFAEIVTRRPHPYYRLLSKETSEGYTRIMAKVIDSRTILTQKICLDDGTEPLGLYLDIFLLDGAGNTREEAVKTYQQAYSIYRHWERSIKKAFFEGQNGLYTFLLWLKHTPERAAGMRYWMKKHDEICERHPYAESIYVGAMGAGTWNPDRNIWKKEWFGDGRDAVFNGEIFRVPDNWDAVLRPEYGDYWTLPPEDERRPHHSFSLEIPDPGVMEELFRTEHAADRRSPVPNAETDEIKAETVSIIIPVYNVERFLDRCVESALQQSYQNIEVLLVDDGSTDGSGKLCDDWKSRDARVRVIHKRNGGASDARNTGIEAAKGRYLAFFDSDDYAAPDMIQKLYDALTVNRADMSICAFRFVDEKGFPIEELNRRLPVVDEVIPGLDGLRDADEINWYYNVVWNKLYRKDLFSEIRFPKRSICEDVIVSSRLMASCRTIACISDVCYNYVQWDGSVLHSTGNGISLYAAEAYLDRACFFRERGLGKAAGKAYAKAAMYLPDAVRYVRDRPELQSELKAFLESFRANAGLRDSCSPAEKLRLSMICRSPELYSALFRNPLRKRVRAILRRQKPGIGHSRTGRQKEGSE